MKCSELIMKLRDIIRGYGDIEIGYENAEYACAEEITSVGICAAERNDALSLGKKFVKIS